MSDNKDNIRARLQALNLGADEAEVYLALLQQPSTHLKLSRDTGISRTKIYRIVAILEKRSLVAKRADDRGTFLVASDPSTLEVELITQEERLKQQRDVLTTLLPSLAMLQSNDSHSFVVRTYEGEEGLKQMCWHELKTKGELLTLGYSTIESIITNRRWAEKHRQRTVEAGYKIRDLINDVDDHSPTFTQNDACMENYICRRIPERLLPLKTQTIIYNDTVAIYHTENEQKVGVEIVNAAFAQSLRTIFEYYWLLATDA